MKSIFPTLMKYLLLLTGILAGAHAIAQTPDANGIVYVKPAATGSGDGSSWGDATSDLHNAIQAANVQKVFVAEGTYKVGDHSFIMKNGVEVYGGFNPGAGIDDLSDSRILPTSTTFPAAQYWTVKIPARLYGMFALPTSKWTTQQYWTALRLSTATITAVAVFITCTLLLLSATC